MSETPTEELKSCEHDEECWKPWPEGGEQCQICGAKTYNCPACYVPGSGMGVYHQAPLCSWTPEEAKAQYESEMEDIFGPNWREIPTFKP